MRVSAPLGAGLRGFVRIRIRGIIGFSGFHFARLALFAIIELPANPNVDKRPPPEDARREES